MQTTTTAYGAGTRDPQGLPNALRVMRGELADEDESSRRSNEARIGPDKSVCVIETNIDDMNPQAFGFVMDKAFALGALDVFLTATQMKKSRPGVMLTILCEPRARGTIIE